jgi:hypothetical protein
MLPAEAAAITDIRQLLGASSKIYSSYVHVMRPEQGVLHEYCNVSDGTQKVSAVLLTPQGQLLPGSSPKFFVLEAQDIMSIDTGKWVKDSGVTPFSGQLVLIVDQVSTQGGPVIHPAITAHWTSPAHHSKVATAAFERINMRSFNRQKSFYMYCSMAVSDARRTTYIVLFNHSTDSGYDDSAEIETILYGRNGRPLQGRPVTIPPFGALIMDVSEHFGAEGTAFFSENNGCVSLTMRHLGHTFPAYFFHVDRHTQDILSGQHAQPSIAALTHFGVWWGKLRQFGF